jgi:hypothetical protein
MAVIDPAVAALLEGPSAQNVATADGDGSPIIGRAWGLRVDRGRSVRALVGADSATAANLQVDSRIGVLVIDLGSYWSVQVKGRVSAVEPPTAADRDVYDVYVREFAAALIEEGRTTPLDEALPAAIVAVTFYVDSVFDQTPGPDAGRSLTASS